MRRILGKVEGNIWADHKRRLQAKTVVGEVQKFEDAT